MNITIDELYLYKKPIHVIIDNNQVHFQVYCEKDKSGKEIPESGCYLTMNKSDLKELSKLL